MTTTTTTMSAAAAAVGAAVGAAAPARDDEAVRESLQQTLREQLLTVTQAFAAATTKSATTTTTTAATEDAPAFDAQTWHQALQGAALHVLAELFPTDPYTVSQLTQAATSGVSAAATATPAPAHAAAAPTSATTSTTPNKKKPIRTYIDGCFDIMHSGHYNAIRQAKALTDILVVGVHSDAEILKHKGPPVMNEQERLAMVRACKWVDEIVFDTPYNPSLQLLIDLNCDFCVHGDDASTTADGRDAYEDVKKAGRMKIVKRTEGISTTDLVGRLLLMTKSHHINASPHSPRLSPVRKGSAGVTSSALLPTGASVPGFLLDSSSASASANDAASADNAASNAGAGVGAGVGAGATAAAIVPRARAESVAEEAHYARAISNFLPTTWRIAQFSNHRVPSPTDKVVYIDGAFDLFHVGHIETLRKAKELGTFLYVGVHDDPTINFYKGKNYPIMNLHERVMNVLSCKYVDEVVIGAPWSMSKDIITTLGIHIVASGSNTKLDTDPESIPGLAEINNATSAASAATNAAASSSSSSSSSSLKWSGSGKYADPYAAVRSSVEFREIETSHSMSTADVVTRIIENRLKYEKRNEKRSKKELDYLHGQKQYIAEV